MAIFHDTFDIVYYETLPVFHSLQETRHRVPITTNTDHQMARKLTNKHFGVGGGGSGVWITPHTPYRRKILMRTLSWVTRIT